MFSQRYLKSSRLYRGYALITRTDQVIGEALNYGSCLGRLGWCTILGNEDRLLCLHYNRPITLSTREHERCIE